MFTFLEHLNFSLDEKHLIKVIFEYSKNKFYVFLKKNEHGKIINIITNTEFNILNKKIYSYEMSGYTEQQIKQNFFEYKNEFLNDEPYYKSNLIVRLYPKCLNKELNSFNVYKKIMFKNFFREKVIDFVDVEITKNEKLKNILSYLNINIKNLNCTDAVFISALKQKWQFLVYKHYKLLLNYLENNDIKNNLEGEELEEYIEEFKLFSDLNVMFSNFEQELDKKNTVIEIISLWPDWLQPKPDFVYED